MAEEAKGAGDTIACLSTKVSRNQPQPVPHFFTLSLSVFRKSKLWLDQSSRQTPINSTQLTCLPILDSPALNAVYAIITTGVTPRSGPLAVTRNAKESTHSSEMVLEVITKSLSLKLGKVRS